MAEIITKCPNCGQTFQISDEWLGKDVTCPQCGSVFCIVEEKNIPEIKLTKIAGRSDGKSTGKGSSSIILAPLADEQEDSHILERLHKWETGITIASIIISIGVFPCVAMFCGIADKGYLSLYFLIAGVVAFFNFKLLNLGLAWARGMYKNLLLNRVAMQTLRENIEKK